MCDKLASNTTIVQAPVANLLQPFCRSDGTIVWRASLAGCSGEQWYTVTNGIFSLTCRPTNLVGTCDQIRYLGPTCMQNIETDQRLLRYTCTLAGVEQPIGLLYIDQASGVPVSSVEANDLVVCEAASEACIEEHVVSSAFVQENDAETATIANFTVAADGNKSRTLVVTLGGERNDSVASLTFNGTPLTLAVEDTLGGQTHASIWYLDVDDDEGTVTGDITVTWTGANNGFIMGALSLHNVRRGGPVEVDEDSANASGPLSLTYTLATQGDFIVESSGFQGGGTGATLPSDLTVLYNISTNAGGGYGAAAGYESVTVTETQTNTWDFSMGNAPRARLVGALFAADVREQQALLVTQCDLPLEMVHSQCVYDQTLNQTLVCEMWVDPNTTSGPSDPVPVDDSIVCFDATGTNNQADASFYGISFVSSGIATDRIAQITYMLPAGTFDGGFLGPTSLVGLMASDISSALGGGNTVLTLTFTAGSFGPGDSFRFGFDTDGLGTNPGSGADFGTNSVPVTVTFESGTTSTDNFVVVIPEGGPGVESSEAKVTVANEGSSGGSGGGLASTRFFRYFTLGTEQEVTNQVTQATLCKCEPCMAQCSIFAGTELYLPFDAINQPSAGLTPDLSGNERHGTMQGAIAAGNPIAGRVNGAFQFTGDTSDFVETLGYQGVTGTQARTVAAWIRIAGGPIDEPIASWGVDVSGQKWTFRVQSNNGIPNTIRVEVNGGFVVGSTPVNDGMWHHVAAVLDPGSVSGAGNTNVLDARLYVDGALEVQSATLGQPMNTAMGANVLVGVDLSNRAWSGAIDEFAIWSRALSDSEILQLASV